MAVTFTQTAFAPLYEAQCDAPGSGTNSSVEPQVFYLLPRGITGPTTLSLNDAWTGQIGCFLFLDMPYPSGQEEPFAQAAWHYLDAPSRLGTRFAWISNPADFQSGLRGPFLALTPTPADPTPYRTRPLAAFDFHNVSLIIGSGCTVDLNPNDGESFVITPPDDTQAHIHFFTGYGQADLLVVQGGVTVPLCGTLAGCLQCEATLSHTGGTADLTHLDAGLRLFFRDIAFPEVGGAFFYTSQRYPVFSETQSGINVYPNLDPLAPLEGTRTFFSFTPLPLQTGETSDIDTYFAINLGHTIRFTPDTDARLIFAQNPTDSEDPGRWAPLYLVPQHSFIADVPDEVTAARSANSAAVVDESFMCGLSGVEYVNLLPDGTNRVTFSPGNDAYAPTFEPGAPAKPTKADDLLTDKATTSWAYFRFEPDPDAEGDTAVYFYAQPDDSVLFSPDAGGDGGATAPFPPLVYMPVPATVLPETLDAVDPLAFPMMPYTGVQSSDLEDLRQMELQVVSPTRRNIVGAIGKAQAEAPNAPATSSSATTDVKGTTPQGLLSTYTPIDGTKAFSQIKELVLSQNDTTETGLEQMLLKGIPRGSDLWTALQANQLFFVVTDPTAIADYLGETDSTLFIKDWLFELNPAEWRPMSGEHPTMLLFKFYDKPLTELAAQISTWSLPEAFNNGDPDQASQTLTSFLQNAIEQCCPDGDGQADCLNASQCASEDFRDFVYDVVLNPRWHGILALNVHVPVDDLPDELQGLAGGIDPSQFFAHHAGVNVSPIDRSTNDLALKPSSLFGLLMYDDPDLLEASGAAYNYKVLKLKVRFKNTQIVDFASQIDLQVNALFQESAALEGGTDNNLVFNGIYQDHDGHASYVFTNEQDNRFTMTSGVLQTVEFVQAQFITLSSEKQDDGTTHVETRFTFWGSVDFKALEGFDIFSFGSDDTTEGALHIANLHVDMSFDLAADPAMVPVNTFVFDAGRIAFDLAQSGVRDDSLFSNFPLKLKAFAQGEQGTLPVDEGYMSVTSPLSQGMLEFPWYALQFDLALGSLGSLAPAGDFIAGLIVAWSPTRTADSYNVFTGLKLPGSEGNKREIPVQGLLKIKIKNIQFYVVPGENTAGDAIISYVLRLQSISLGFFSISLPPQGRTDFLIFGDPEATSGENTLGWYAVYDQGAKPLPASKPLIPPSTLPGTP